MNLFQIVFGFIVAAIIVRIATTYRSGRIRLRQLVIYELFWAVVLIAISFPEATNKIASVFSIGRGADFVIYVSLILVFYILFRIYERIERIERDITTITRHIALRDGEGDDGDRNK